MSTNESETEMTEQTYTREDMARILNNAGWTCGRGAQEPGNYDDCDDCWEVCMDVADVVIRALPEMLARAWEHGHSWGWSDARAKARAELGWDIIGPRMTWRLLTANPYEQEEA